jgi:hypothetical protein
MIVSTQRSTVQTMTKAVRQMTLDTVADLCAEVDQRRGDPAEHQRGEHERERPQPPGHEPCGLDALASTQREHTSVLDCITELRHQVEEILSTLTEDDNASPAEWFWLRMTEQVREEKFAELFDWVETVLRTQYPDYLADQIRPCWPNHPEARWELSWLYQQWSLTYLRQTTGAKRRGGVARPLVPRRNSPPEHRHEPLRSSLPPPTRRQPGLETAGDSLSRVPL